MLTVHSDAHDKEGIDPGLRHEEEVVVVVVDTDTVVGPGAMVVEALHTDVTDGAVT